MSDVRPRRARAAILSSLGSVVVVLATLSSSAGARGSATLADQGDWQGPQTLNGTNQSTDLVATATSAGEFVTWRDLGSGGRYVAHRDLGPDGTWSSPKPLPDYGKGMAYGPLLGLPERGAVQFATRAGEHTSFWEVSTDGVPSSRQRFPSRLFTPEAADVAAGRWLVAGTAQRVAGKVRVALRGPKGHWRVSVPLPHPSFDVANLDLVGAWFDRVGRPHVMAVLETTDTRVAAPREPGGARTGGRPIVEAILRPDGSWGSNRPVATTLDFDSAAQPLLAVNADGDASVSYVVGDGAGSVVSKVRTRAYGAHSWSKPVTIPDPSSKMGIDAAGRATIVCSVRGGARAGRLDEQGRLDGWQADTDPAFDRTYFETPLTVSRSGTAVLAMFGTLTAPDGQSEVLRTARCLPGRSCELVGDFEITDYANPSLVSGPAGAAYLLSHSTPPCGSLVYCGWRLPAP